LGETKKEKKKNGGAAPKHERNITVRGPIKSPKELLSEESAVVVKFD
jgi:hypothetical protein